MQSILIRAQNANRCSRNQKSPYTLLTNAGVATIFDIDFFSFFLLFILGCWSICICIGHRCRGGGALLLIPVLAVSPGRLDEGGDSRTTGRGRRLQCFHSPRSLKNDHLMIWNTQHNCTWCGLYQLLGSKLSFWYNSIQFLNFNRMSPVWVKTEVQPRRKLLDSLNILTLCRYKFDNT